MRIVEINSYTELGQLRAEWNDFLDLKSNSIFQTWDWISTWWKHFGNNRVLILLLLEENSKIQGIAPLMLSTAKLSGFTFRKIEFVGTPITDYNSFILNSNQVNFSKLFVRYLNNSKRDWNYMELSEIPQTANWLEAFKNAAILQQTSKCSFLRLPDSYEAFLKGLSHKRRGSIGTSIRKMEKNFDVRLVDYSKPSDCSKGLRSLIELHQKRWTNVGATGALSDTKTCDFHHEIAKSFAEQGKLGLYLLELNGKPVSGLYGFKTASKYFAYLSGFDPEYQCYGVGANIFPYVINQLINKGIIVFDMMRGEEDYKERWGAIPTWNYRVVDLRDRFIEKIKFMLYKRIRH